MLLLTRKLSVGGGEDEDHSPARPGSAAPDAADRVDPDDGPVMVTVEYLIDPPRPTDFNDVMQQTRRARLRQGALSWGLFRDPAVPGRYIEYFLDETWVEHLRRLERFTASRRGPARAPPGFPHRRRAAAGAALHRRGHCLGTVR